MGRLLESISDQSFLVDDVIVVDGGSSDDTVKVVEEFGTASIVRGSPPVGSQRNLGADQASSETELFLFLDADVVLPPAFLERLAKEFPRRRLACCGFRYVPYHPALGANLATRAFFKVANTVFRVSQGTRFASASGHGLAVDAKSFHYIGGFDANMQFDDMDLVRRLARDNRVGIVGKELLVSDRRWRKFGAPRMAGLYALLSLSFLVNRVRWGNLWDYEWGKFSAPDNPPQDSVKEDE